MSDVKAFFHNWCAKNNVEPSFDVRPTGPKHRQRFLCELRVHGHLYVGAGNSTTKKIAQSNAATDFVQYLVRQKLVSENEVPNEVSSAVGPPPNDNSGASRIFNVSSSRPVYQPGLGPESMGTAYTPMQLKEEDGPKSYIDIIAQQKNVEEAEGVDVNASIHGNWTIENAKSKLHQYLQLTKIHADYKYTVVGPDHCRGFVAEMTIRIPNLGRSITARETGSNKQTASKSCALSLVRQMYHLGVIEAFTGTLKKESSNQIPPYDVKINPDLMQRATRLLESFNIKPPSIETPKSPDDVISLLSSHAVDEFISQPQQTAGVISWSPPIQNWNAWTGCNIDEEGSSVSLDQISDELYKSWKERTQSNVHLQDLLRERESLPVFHMRAGVMQTINDNSVVIIRGNTGCGKTTQVCQFILDDYIKTNQGAYCNIVVTQPRRISAVSVSDRVASERGEELGGSVGYSVRFESILPRPYGGILFCTVGVLLRKLENGLRGVSHVIVDEIHERNVDTDFLLVIVRDMVHTYPDLRVILMSATIDTSLFSEYFNNCPVVEVTGSAFPVESYFLEDIVEMLDFFPPPNTKKNKNKDQDDLSIGAEDDENMNLIVPDNFKPSTKAALAKMSEKETSFELIEAIIKHCKSMNLDGAMLIFLPGWSIIFALMRHLLQHPIFSGQGYRVIPLHSQIPREDQRKVFEPVPPGVMKIILSTNIAETSITINDILFVVDVGKAKVKLFTSHNNMTNYATMWCSKTNIEQRKGRAGRVRPGFAFHLMTRARYEKLSEHMTPEILRTPLHQLALSIKLLKLGNIGHFLSKAIEPPPLDAVIEAEVLLREMKCLDLKSELTSLGRILARLPIEPRLGKMMILGCIFRIGDGLATIAANSSTFPEVFITEGRLMGFQRAFTGTRSSDHIAMLNVYTQWASACQRSPEAEFNFCESKQVSASTLKITADAKCQLKDLLVSCGFSEETMQPKFYQFRGEDLNLDMMLALMCMGFYPNVCFYKEKRKVLTTESKPALIHKTSVNCSKFEKNFTFPFFVFGEKIRTRAVSCKQTTMVSPIHLLLFGCRKVEIVDKYVRLDNWINLNMDLDAAAVILELRKILEDMTIRASENPETVTSLSENEKALTDVILELCSINAGRFGFEPKRDTRPSFKSLGEPFRPTKMIRGESSRGHYRGYGGGCGRGGFRGYERGPYDDNFGNRFSGERGGVFCSRGYYRGARGGRSDY